MLVDLSVTADGKLLKVTHIGRHRQHSCADGTSNEENLSGVINQKNNQTGTDQGPVGVSGFHPNPVRKLLMIDNVASSIKPLLPHLFSMAIATPEGMMEDHFEHALNISCIDGTECLRC